MLMLSMFLLVAQITTIPLLRLPGPPGFAGMSGMSRQESLRDFDYSADQDWIVVVSDTAIRHIRATATSPSKVVRIEVPANKVCFSPVERDTFAVGHDRSLVSVYKIGAEEPHSKFVIHRDRSLTITGLDYSPDGKHLAVCGRGKDMSFYSVRDALTGEERFGETLAKPTYGDCIAFSSDGDSLAIAGGRLVQILSMTDGTKQQRLAFSPGFATSLSFTPDGKRLVVTGGHCVPAPRAKYPRSCDPTGCIWLSRIDSAAPMQRIILPSRHGYFRGANVTADGKSFLTAATHHGSSAPTSPVSVQLRSTTTGQVLWSRSLLGNSPIASVLSPDKKTASTLTLRSLIHLNSADGTMARAK